MTNTSTIGLGADIRSHAAAVAADFARLAEWADRHADALGDMGDKALISSAHHPAGDPLVQILAAALCARLDEIGRKHWREIKNLAATYEVALVDGEYVLGDREAVAR